MNKKILLINGPNLNLLGSREPGVYGTETLFEVEDRVQKFFDDKGYNLIRFQSNHEGRIIDFLHEHKDADYLIINPGGLTHTSVALRDALLGVAIPFVEVHISNTFSREEFRHHSFLSSIASGVMVGCGTYGYQLAAELIHSRISAQ